MALTQVAGGMLAGSITSSQISSVAGSTITGSQSIPKSTLPTGSVLQVVNGSTSSQVSTASNAYLDTGLTATITPSSATSKVLVMCTFSYSAPTSVTQTLFRAMRDSTAIFLGDSSGSRTQATAGSTYVSDFNGQSALTVSFQFIDSPATTSATTYKLQGKSNGNAWYVGRSGSDGDGSNSPRLPLTIIASEVTAS